jgi:hypothetical protein
MRFKIISTFYWTTFILSIIVIFLNLGLGIIFGLLIIPILVIHYWNGSQLDKLKNHKKLIVFSALNLLVFSLVRPDGVHSFTTSRLSEVLDFFGIDDSGLDENEGYLFVASLLLLVAQGFADFELRKIRKEAE